MTKKPARAFFLIVIVLIAAIAMMNLISGPSPFGQQPKELAASDLNDAITNHNVAQSEWQQTTLAGTLKDGVKFTAKVPDIGGPGAAEFDTFLRQNKVPYKRMDPPASTAVLGILSVVAFPIMLVALIYFLVLRPSMLNWPSFYTVQTGGNPNVTKAATGAARREGFHTVTPYLVVDDPLAFLEFASTVFGATGTHQSLRPDGTVMHLEMRIGDSMVMVGGSNESVPAQPSRLHLYVDNVDELYNRAIQAGATSLRVPRDEVQGDRMGGVLDKFGISWWIATRRT